MGFSIYPPPIRNYLLKTSGLTGSNSSTAVGEIGGGGGCGGGNKSSYEDADESAAAAVAAAAVYRGLMGDKTGEHGFHAQNAATAAAVYNQFVNMNAANGIFF
jgi:hypothetical protein